MHVHNIGIDSKLVSSKLVFSKTTCTHKNGAILNEMNYHTTCNNNNDNYCNLLSSFSMQMRAVSLPPAISTIRPPLTEFGRLKAVTKHSSYSRNPSCMIDTSKYRLLSASCKVEMASTVKSGKK